MNLQDMLGDAYHDGMTVEEINTALSGKKFADLSTGNYVDKNKYTADLTAKDTELASVKEQLNSKLSDSEKEAASAAADKAKIEELQKLLQQQTISTNKDKAEALTSDVKSILDIKPDDKDYAKLLDTLSNCNTDDTRVVAAYINKIVKDSYEKGKKDATKDDLGDFGKDVGKAGAKKDEIGKFGKELAAGSKPSVDPNLYFGNNK